MKIQKIWGGRGKTEYIASLDGLRGLTICMIAFLWHYWMLQPENGYPLSNIFLFSYNLGYLGVEVFFMISGFVMAYNYQNKIANNEISFNKYFFRRVKHLWFINFITLLLVAVEHFIYFKYTGTTYVAANFDLWHFILNAFLLQYGITELSYSFNVPAWCLTTELICYLVYYVIIKKDKDGEYWIIKSIGIILIGLAVLSQGFRYPIINFEVARGMVSFFIGVLLCWGFKKYRGYKCRLINAGIYFFLTASYLGFRKYGIDWISNYVYYTVLCFAPLILWVTVNDTVVSKLLSTRVPVFLGKISLYIYLLHFPIQYFIKILDTIFNLRIKYSTLSFLGFYCFVTILVSAIAYSLKQRKRTKEYVNL